MRQESLILSKFVPLVPAPSVAAQPGTRLQVNEVRLCACRAREDRGLPGCHREQCQAQWHLTSSLIISKGEG